MLAIACSHASGAPAGRRPSSNGPSPRTSSSDVSAAAAQLSEETHALLRAEGDLLWTRWTTGSGPLPSGALADHPRLFQRGAAASVDSAAGSERKAPDQTAPRLLHRPHAGAHNSRDRR